MAEEWGLIIPKYGEKIKRFVLQAVEDGEVIQTKGKFLQFEYNFLTKHYNPLLPGQNGIKVKFYHFSLKNDDEKNLLSLKIIYHTRNQALRA